MNEFATLAAFATLGLLSLPHCIAMCGPIAAKACVGQSEADNREALAYLLGRTTSYMFLGAVAGTVGATALGEAGRYASLVMLELAAVVMFAQGVHRLLPRLALPSLARRHAGLVANGLRFIPSGGLPLGLATGFLPCGALAAALALAVAAGSPMLAAAGMTVFALAGAPALVLPVLLLTSSTHRLRMRPALLSRIAGAAMIVLSIFIAARPFAFTATGFENEHCSPAIHEATLR